MRSQPLLKLKAEKKRLTLRQRLIEVSRGFPARFEEQDDGTLKLELKVAERKVLLSRKTLMYRARVKVDDDRRTVKFFETLKETGLGLTSGDSTDMSPGLGFKKETYKITGRGREGNIEELSKLFGKDYRYSWDYSKVRKNVQHETEQAGYTFSISLNERDL
jgi:hypothetical protein